MCPAVWPGVATPLDLCAHLPSGLTLTSSPVAGDVMVVAGDAAAPGFQAGAKDKDGLTMKKKRAPGFKETNLVSKKGLWAVKDEFPRLPFQGAGHEVRGRRPLSSSDGEPDKGR